MSRVGGRLLIDRDQGEAHGWMLGGRGGWDWRLAGRLCCRQGPRQESGLAWLGRDLRGLRSEVRGGGRGLKL